MLPEVVTAFAKHLPDQSARLFCRPHPPSDEILARFLVPVRSDITPAAVGSLSLRQGGHGLSMIMAIEF